jgi:hypothetical protein
VGSDAKSQPKSSPAGGLNLEEEFGKGSGQGGHFDDKSERFGTGAKPGPIPTTGPMFRSFAPPAGGLNLEEEFGKGSGQGGRFDD